jgi:hypothetical protein
VDFFAYSGLATIALTRFTSSTRDGLSNLRALYQRAILCSYQIIIISVDDLERNQVIAEPNDSLITWLLHVWPLRHKSNPESRLSIWNEIIQVADCIFPPEAHSNEMDFSLLTRCLLKSHSSDECGRNIFYIMLDGSEKFGIPLFYINYLVNRWQIEQGNLPLHASGVVRNNGLFIFLGPSGAGKSTVAQLSAEQGCHILDEDQLAVYSLEDGSFSANGWGYNLAPSNIPIQGIFRLVQSSNDKIISIGQTKSAHSLLLKSFFEVMGENVPSEYIQSSFHFVATLARQVPAFELYFRKSPDFWKLIDEQFSD